MYTLNDTLVTPSSNTYPFRSYVETLLSYGAEAKKTQLTSQLWYKDTAGHMEATQENAGNVGLVDRCRHIAESRVVDMMGRLHVDLFLQDKFLLNGVDVKIRLVRSKDAFSLMAGGANPDYKVRIVEAILFARKAVLSPTVQMAHIKALAKGTAKYPLRPVDCQVYSIPQGAMSHTHENLFLGTLPKRLILWCIDNGPKRFWSEVTVTVFKTSRHSKLLFFVKNKGQWNAKSGPKVGDGKVAM